jgi:hypothetical protein
MSSPACQAVSIFGILQLYEPRSSREIFVNCMALVSNHNGLKQSMRHTSILGILRTNHPLFCLKRSFTFLTTSLVLMLRFLSVFLLICTWLFKVLSMNRRFTNEVIHHPKYVNIFFTFFMQRSSMCKREKEKELRNVLLLCLSYRPPCILKDFKIFRC